MRRAHVPNIVRAAKHDVGRIVRVFRRQPDNAALLATLPDLDIPTSAIVEALKSERP